MAEENSPVNYNGTAIMNGRKINTIRGFSFDIFYVLSNYLKFDVEFEQTTSFTFTEDIWANKA